MNREEHFPNISSGVRKSQGMLVGDNEALPMEWRISYSTLTHTPQSLDFWNSERKIFFFPPFWSLHSRSLEFCRAWNEEKSLELESRWKNFSRKNSDCLVFELKVIISRNQLDLWSITRSKGSWRDSKSANENGEKVKNIVRLEKWEIFFRMKMAENWVSNNFFPPFIASPQLVWQVATKAT
jgi:hypothetical protein